MISQADGARLMAAHAKAVKASAAMEAATAGRDETARRTTRKLFEAAERKFSDLVSKLTEPE